MSSRTKAKQELKEQPIKTCKKDIEQPLMSNNSKPQSQVQCTQKKTAKPSKKKTKQEENKTDAKSAKVVELHTAATPEYDGTCEENKKKYTALFNSKGFMHMFLGGKERVVRMVPTSSASTSKADNKPLQMDFMERGAFQNRFAHMSKVMSGRDAVGRPVFSRPASIWLGNKFRTLADGVCFNPEETPLKVNQYGQFNLYQGRAVNPAKCSREDSVKFLKPFLDHLMLNLCKGDRETFWTFLYVMAAKYQNPTIKPFATIIHGVEGTGKDTIVEPFMRLYGAHGKKATKAEQVVGTYNAGTLSNCLFLWMDEAFAGKKEATDCMKTVVFSEELSLTDKFIPAWKERVLNQTIMTTNRENMIRFATGDRRYFVLEMSEERVGDSEYFSGLWELIESRDFLRHLANLLLKTNVDGFNYRKPPVTESKAIQTLSTAEPEERFLFKMIMEGGFRPFYVTGAPEGQEPVIHWPEKVSTSELEQAFDHWLKITGTPFGKNSSIALGRVLPKFGFKKTEVRAEGKRGRGWKFPDISNAKAHMSKVLGMDIEKLDI